MATTRISAMATSQPKDNLNYFALDKAGSTTGKRVWTDIVSDMKADIGMVASDVGLGNVTNTEQCAKATYDLHIAGTADKHDSTAIVYGSTNVGAYLTTLANKIDAQEIVNARLNIEFETGGTLATETWTEAEVLTAMGIDNAEYANFNYVIDHRFAPSLYKLAKSSSYGTNVALADDDFRISWQASSTTSANHLDAISLNSTAQVINSDYRLMLDLKLTKEYITTAF